MPTSVPNRRSIYGISCVKCSNKLMAPVKSEFRDGAAHPPYVDLPEMYNHPLNRSNSYPSRI